MFYFESSNVLKVMFVSVSNAFWCNCPTQEVEMLDSEVAFECSFSPVSFSPAFRMHSKTVLKLAQICFVSFAAMPMWSTFCAQWSALIALPSIGHSLSLRLLRVICLALGQAHDKQMFDLRFWTDWPAFGWIGNLLFVCSGKPGSSLNCRKVFICDVLCFIR